jgi:hypothetical protein
MPSARGDPNCVLDPTRASTGPNGRLRSATACPGLTSAITCAGLGFGFGRGIWTRTQPAVEDVGPTAATRPTAVVGARAAATALTQTTEANAMSDRATPCGSAGGSARASLERGACE